MDVFFFFFSRPRSSPLIRGWFRYREIWPRRVSRKQLCFFLVLCLDMKSGGCRLAAGWRIAWVNVSICDRSRGIRARWCCRVGVLVSRFLNQVRSWSYNNCRKFMWGATTKLESSSRISQSEESINTLIFAPYVKGGSGWANGEWGMEFFHSDNWDCWDHNVWVAMSPTSSLFSPPTCYWLLISECPDSCCSPLFWSSFSVHKCWWHMDTRREGLRLDLLSSLSHTFNVWCWGSSALMGPAGVLNMSLLVLFPI